MTTKEGGLRGSIRNIGVGVSAIPDSALSQKADHLWYMNEGSGQTLADSVGTEDITLTGTTWTSGQGTNNTSPLFDGVDDVGTDGEILTDGNPFTVAFWGRTPTSDDTSPTKFRYLCQQGVTDFLTQCITDEGASDEVAIQYIIAGQEQEGATSAPTVVENTPTLFVISYDGTDAEGWYAQAGLDASVTSLGTVTGVTTSFTAGENFTIGNREDQARPWPGWIDYGLLAFEASTETEANDHFSQTEGLYL